MNLGVYIHIPFCRQKCLYCDFPSYVAAEHLYYDYFAALCREISGRGGLLSAYNVDTIYIGGGTPTVLPPQLLFSISDCLRRSFAITDNAEFTVEANPGTLLPETLDSLRACGVNRLSIGVQAFDDGVLAGAGRIHSAKVAKESVMAAFQKGFDNINIDLMYGLPGQSVESFYRSLEQAVTLPVRHLSVYGLKVEEGTPFAALRDQHRLPLPDEDAEAEMYRLTTEFLPDNGFDRYEISNYAQCGMECKHNLKYWRFKPYIGLGAAAHSFLVGERSANLRGVTDYIVAVNRGEWPVEEREKPTKPVAMAEYIFLALRTSTGLLFEDFQATFSADFLEMFGDMVEKLEAKRLIEVSGEGIFLTPTGMKYGNIVFGEFLP
jgi:oxygen-independent coproporphyrinogen-3 oxidase